ncbi:MAG: NAD-dependent epimerase/dehydratase family protein, partial [Kiritimatiellae bacterium]|nr:NAD-dependent epimerase/dehydratase family protein [Kiritimatiellia bacterium]
MAETALVTGATGLIGGALVRAFAADGMRVVAPVRDVAKARRTLADVPGVVFAEWDMSHPHGGALAAAGGIDRVVHAASPTSRRFFAEHPAETESMIADSTRALLDLACSAGAKAFVFLSSMEAYGAPPDDAPLGEDAPF